MTLGELARQPSFPEFVAWLLRDRAGQDGSPHSWARDNTWVPYYAVCPVCQHNYTVLKLDSEKLVISFHYIYLYF